MSARRLTRAAHLELRLDQAALLAALPITTYLAVTRPGLTAPVVVGMMLLIACHRDLALGVGIFSPLIPLILAVTTSLIVPAALGAFDAPGLFATSESANVQATLIASGFLLCAITTYVLIPSRQKHTERSVLNANWSAHVSLLVWGFSAAAAGFAFLQLVASAGGFEAYLVSLSNRAVSLAGRGAFVWLLLAPGAVSLAFLAAYWTNLRGVASSAHLTRLHLLPVPVAASSSLFLLATGNRMNFIVYLATLAYVRHRFRKPVSSRAFLFGILVVAAIGLTLPSVLRTGESLNERSLSVPSLASQYEEFGPVNTFGQVPALAMALDHDLPRQDGATYLAAATMFIPRSIAPWKLPDIGPVVTEQVLPVYHSMGTSVQVGAAGEAFLNFGALGVIGLGVIFGVAMAAVRALMATKSALTGLVLGLLVPRSALYFRGGFATVTVYLLMDLAIVLAAVMISKHRAIGGLQPDMRFVRPETGGRGQNETRKSWLARMP